MIIFLLMPVKFLLVLAVLGQAMSKFTDKYLIKIHSLSFYLEIILFEMNIEFQHEFIGFLKCKILEKFI